MPTYQYACTDATCGHRFEAVQAFADDPLTSCPQCEGQLRKVFSAVGVVFKGSGFYRTDSRAAATNGASDGARSEGSGNGSGSSESSGSGGKTDGGGSSSESGGSKAVPKSGSGGTKSGDTTKAAAGSS